MSEEQRAYSAAQNAAAAAYIAAYDAAYFAHRTSTTPMMSVGMAHEAAHVDALRASADALEAVKAAKALP